MQRHPSGSGTRTSFSSGRGEQSLLWTVLLLVTLCAAPSQTHADELDDIVASLDCGPVQGNRVLARNGAQILDSDPGRSTENRLHFLRLRTGCHVSVYASRALAGQIPFEGEETRGKFDSPGFRPTNFFAMDDLIAKKMEMAKVKCNGRDNTTPKKGYLVSDFTACVYERTRRDLTGYTLVEFVVEPVNGGSSPAIYSLVVSRDRFLSVRRADQAPDPKRRNHTERNF